MGFEIKTLISKIDKKAEKFVDDVGDKAEEFVDDVGDKANQVKSKIKNIGKKYESWVNMCTENDNKIEDLKKLKGIIRAHEAYIIRRRKKLEEMLEPDGMFSSGWECSEWSGEKRDMFDTFLEAQLAAYTYYQNTLNTMVDEIVNKICELECEKNNIFGRLGDLEDKYEIICSELEKDINDWDWVNLL